MANFPNQLRIVGKVVLVSGLLAAVGIFITAPPDKSGGILGIDIRTNRQRAQLERTGGGSYILFKELDDWFGSLWHGRRLSYTVGVLSILSYLFFRGLAHAEDDFSKTALESAVRKDRTAGESPGPTR